MPNLDFMADFLRADNVIGSERGINEFKRKDAGKQSSGDSQKNNMPKDQRRQGSEKPPAALLTG